MAEAAQIFNPIFLVRQSDTDVVTVLHCLTDKLATFNFYHFDDKFIKKLKKEILALVQEAKGDHDLERIPSTCQCQTRMERKIKRKNLPTNVNLDWKDNVGECAQRIWK